MSSVGREGASQCFSFATPTDSFSIFLPLTIQTTFLSSDFQHFREPGSSAFARQEKRNGRRQQRTPTGEKANTNFPGMSQNGEEPLDDSGSPEGSPSFKSKQIRWLFGPKTILLPKQFSY